MILNAKKFWTWWTTELREWFGVRYFGITKLIEKTKEVILNAIADLHGETIARKDDLDLLAKDATVAKEAAATRNKEDVIRAIGAIPQPIIPTDYAKEATLSGGITRLRQDISALRGGTATVEQVKNIASALRNGLTQEDRVWLQHQFAGIDLSSITNILNNSTYGLQALKALIDAKVIPADYAKEATLTQQSSEIKTAIAKGGGNPSKLAFDSMKSINPWLYTIEYDALDYEAARRYFKETLQPQLAGSCSAIRNGNLYGRNLDWNYNNLVEFIVRTRPHDGRFASIGFAGSVSTLDKDSVKEYSEAFRYMPFRMLDGINEHGLACNVNMLNPDNVRSQADEGSTPTAEQREEICSVMLVRYILDNFKTAQEACDYIKKYVRVYPPKHDGHKTDLHFALCDNQGGTYYLAFEGTSCIVINATGHPFVMTNFRMKDYHLREGHFYVEDTGIEDYGSGIERANLMVDFLADTETEKTVLEFMAEDLKWTNCYYQQETPWLTDFVGDGVTKTDSAALAAIQANVINSYAALIAQGDEAVRNNGNYWHTTHTVVYDLEHLSLQFVSQEEDVDRVTTLPCFDWLYATKEDLSKIDIPTDDLASKANQRKMMVNFGMSEGEPQLQALTDTEIINTYNGYEDEGEHIEGIADQTYGHLVPAQVTIDDEPFTFYQERTYADYGYSVLYRNGVAIDTTTTHPAENDVLTTSLVES